MSVADLQRFLKEEVSRVPKQNRVAGNGEVVYQSPVYHPSLGREELLDIYTKMYMSRRTDDQEIMFLKKGKANFAISCAGAEAVGVAAGKVLRKTDPICPYYRDRALVIARGVTPFEMLLEAVFSAKDPASGGRQMPSHFGNRKLGVIPQTSPTGSQCLPAQGLAEAIAKTGKLLKSSEYPPDSVCYVSIGDDATSQGEFYEAIKSACQYKSPTVFHIIDNGFGISVSIEETIPNTDPSGMFKGMPGLKIVKCDGTSVRESFDAFRDAVNYARSRRGPAIVHSKVVRLYSHSSSDDQKKYRTKTELELEKSRDPITRFAKELIAYGVATAEELIQINESIDEHIRNVAEEALSEPKTDTSMIFSRIWNFDKAMSLKKYRDIVGSRRSEYTGQIHVLAEALNRSLDELMGLDGRIIMWGEDIADLSPSRLARHPELEGKGGVFGVTKGLQRKHGTERVFNAMLAEASIVGKAMGYSIQGFLPVPEIQFRDFINPAWQVLVDEISTLSFRSCGAFTCPMVIRMASSGYLMGAGSIWHSETGAGIFLNQPGLRVAVLSNPKNGVGTLRGALYSGDPVLILEPKALYRRRGGFFDTPYPDFDFVTWPGEDNEVYSEGKDLAIISYGNVAWICYTLLPELKKAGVKAKLVNLTWLNPLNENLIRTVAEECGKVLICEEDRRTCGAGAAIADIIYRDKSLRKKIDIERIAAKDSRVPYGDVGEKCVLPQPEDILKTAISFVKG